MHGSRIPDYALIDPPAPGLLIKTPGEDRLHGAVGEAAVVEGAGASGFQAQLAVALGQTQGALCGTQALQNAIGEQAVDEFGAGRAHGGGLLCAPVAVTGEEFARRWRQMLEHRVAAPGVPATGMG